MAADPDAPVAETTLSSILECHDNTERKAKLLQITDIAVATRSWRVHVLCARPRNQNPFSKTKKCVKVKYPTKYTYFKLKEELNEEKEAFKRLKQPWMMPAFPFEVFPPPQEYINMLVPPIKKYDALLSRKPEKVAERAGHVVAIQAKPNFGTWRSENGSASCVYTVWSADPVIKDDVIYGWRLAVDTEWTFRGRGWCKKGPGATVTLAPYYVSYDLPVDDDTVIPRCYSGLTKESIKTQRALVREAREI